MKLIRYNLLGCVSMEGNDVTKSLRKETDQHFTDKSPKWLVFHG